jgi:hypothetical protein
MASRVDFAFAPAAKCNPIPSPNKEGSGLEGTNFCPIIFAAATFLCSLILRSNILNKSKDSCSELYLTFCPPEKCIKFALQLFNSEKFIKMSRCHPGTTFIFHWHFHARPHKQNGMDAILSFPPRKVKVLFWLNSGRLDSRSPEGSQPGQSKMVSPKFTMQIAASFYTGYSKLVVVLTFKHAQIADTYPTFHFCK